MNIKNCLNIMLLIFMLSIFNGCVKLDNLKENIFYSVYSQKKSDNFNKDKQILDLYEANFSENKILSLSSKEFSRENAKIGLWLPYKFIKNTGGGLYFLDEYDSEKTVVLFVHGAAGTPLDWKNIIKNLDKDKFQPLVVSYPTGINLKHTVKIINTNIRKLVSRYGINKIIVVAHSMGGIVSKALIKELNQKDKIVNLFITISTPWNGHNGASNTERLPYYIPSWNDMKKNSDFIQNIKDNSILENVEYYLFFGYQGKMTLYGRDNDGTISLESQLAEYAQSSAKRIIGFNENHTSILFSNKVSLKINIILKDKL